MDSKAVKIQIQANPSDYEFAILRRDYIESIAPTVSKVITDSLKSVDLDAFQVQKGVYYLDSVFDRGTKLYYLAEEFERIQTGTQGTLLKRALRALAKRETPGTLLVSVKGNTGAEVLQNVRLTIDIISSEFDTSSGWNVTLGLPESKAARELTKERGHIQTNRINTFLSDYKGKIYAGGSTWENVDMTESFLTNEEWVNAKGDQYHDEVNAIEPGDIFIIKSTYGTGKRGWFRVKAIGRVTSNNGDGDTLKVKWIQILDSLDISGHLASKRRTLHELTKEEFSMILDASNPTKSQLEQLFPRSKEASKNYHTNLSNDSALSTEDLLGFDKDIEVFASIIALKKLHPPLAIGLFGNWGTGKSFFMHNLKNRVELLSKNDWNEGTDLSNQENENLFCEGIAQIHFNAWSYLDSNLWASLVSKIFEELQQHLGGNSPAKERILGIQKDLAEELFVTNVHKKMLDAKARKLEQRSKELVRKKIGADKDLQAKLNLIKSTTSHEVIDKVRTDLEIDDKLNSLLKEINLELKEKTDLDPEEVLKEVRSARTFARQLLTFSCKDIGWIALIVVLFIGPTVARDIFSIGWIPKILPSSSLASIGTLITLFVKGRKTLNELAPAYTSALAIRDNYLSKVESAISEHKQNEKAINIEIDLLENEIVQIQNQILIVEEEQAKIRFAKDNTLAQHALHSFITERSKSADYQERLGIISTIRKDFETLSDLFYASRDETLRRHLSEEKKQLYDSIRGDIEGGQGQGLDRIVLYIDDLDRCPEERVVEVLEAVHLLLAFPLFVVVVGVDPRWVRNALIKKYQVQFGTQLTDIHSSEDGEVEKYERISATEFLEKIFQIPFNLKSANSEGVRNIIDQMLKGSIRAEESQSYAPNDSPDDLPKPEIVDELRKMEDEETIKESEPSELKSLSRNALILNEYELEDIKKLSPILGNTPRSIKRFVNIYRIVRAHDNIADQNLKQEDYQIIMFLLALPIGKYKEVAEDIYNILHLDSTEGSLADFLGKNEADQVDPYPKLMAELNKSPILNLKNDKFQKHLPFIRRFNFNLQ